MKSKTPASSVWPVRPPTSEISRTVTIFIGRPLTASTTRPVMRAVDAAWARVWHAGGRVAGGLLGRRLQPAQGRNQSPRPAIVAARAHVIY